MRIIPKRPKKDSMCVHCGEKIPQNGKAAQIITHRGNWYVKKYIHLECVAPHMHEWSEWVEGAMEDEPTKPRKRRCKYANPNHKLIALLSYHRKKGHKEKVNDILSQLLPY
jgi:hypothetical protein